MNRKIGIIVVVIALALGAVWLFHTPETAAPAAKVAEAPKPAPNKIEPPKLAVKSQVAAPVAPAAAPKASTVPAKADGDPQAELSTALSDIIGLIQSGNIWTAAQRYIPPEVFAKLPPEERADMEKELTTNLSQPEAQQGMQMMVTVLQSMQTQTPTMNDTGDKATYQMTDPSGRSTRTQPFSMKKIDGKWYVDPEMMGGML